MKRGYSTLVITFVALGALAAPTRAGIVPARGLAQMRHPVPAVDANACKQKHVGTNVYSDPVTLYFPTDCGASGSMTVPGIMEGPNSFGMVAQACVSPQPIVGGSKACPDSSVNPKNLCTQAASTFWYVSTKFQAKILNGSGSYQVTFKSGTFPIVFTSSALIVPGYTYGLCVLTPSGAVVQDDFATGNGVSPQGDSIDLTMTLPAGYLTFDYREVFLLYFESKAA
jgi:hypothetical protein